MILFRRITLRERWEKRRALVLGVAATGIAAVLAFDLLTDGAARRTLAEAVRLAMA